ncbi:hypothetical protein BIY23_00975 [Wolbachia pipientis]|uniref:Uncharacterized protein n=1 Tax=Wolbachia pipientis TaxID=955 RepID=A0A1E7QL27_WOLPI|nr:hypothetical protein BIY23_00975 [Wolbachia pipientis]
MSPKVNNTDKACYEGIKRVEKLTPCALYHGIHIEVCNLCFATPNRLKFLKSERAETKHIVNIISNLAMINYCIGFTLISGNKKLLKYIKQPLLLGRC